MSTADAPLPAAPHLDGPPPHLLVVRAPYYPEVVDGLRDGAARILREAGAGFDVLDVAGALELAGAIRLAVARHPALRRLCRARLRRARRDRPLRVCLPRGDGRADPGGAAVRPVPRQRAADRGHASSRRSRARRPDGHNKGAEAAVAALLQIRAARWLGAV